MARSSVFSFVVLLGETLGLMLSNNLSLSSRSSDCQSLAHQIKSEKMDEIVDYILQGKYSSACLLLLESTGQDPLHYIPYRTYNRLQKQRQKAIASAHEVDSNASVASLRSRLTDLDYVEALPKEACSAQGGLSTAASVSWLEKVFMFKKGDRHRSVC